MRLKKFLPVILFVLIGLSAFGQRKDPFSKIPDTYPVLQKVLANPETYKVQILYSQIDRDKSNTPTWRDFSFRLDDDVYFYPASTVKLPVAILALEWLGEQQIPGLTADTPMLTDSVRPTQIPAYKDSTAANGLPGIAHYIKKILLVSDNDAYNRLYELLGQDYINRKMREKGFSHTVINHRLSMPMPEAENRHFNPIRFVDADGKTILSIPARETTGVYANPGNPSIGKAYYSGGKLVGQPMDFTYKNKFALSDLHGVVQRIVFPERFEPAERFHISESDRQFILRYMSMLPGESDFPKYPMPDYYDSYSKFFKFGTDQSPIPARFRIFNKTGNAYGHLLDGSYFVDFQNGVEFFVSAIIYTNADETLNDDKYEYEEVAFPFFAELGEYLYQIELSRKKKRQADLSSFKFSY
jgi:hypothetical protein